MNIFLVLCEYALRTDILYSNKYNIKLHKTNYCIVNT